MGDMRLPFTKATRDQIFGDWVDVLNRGECGSIIHIPKRSQLWRINQFLNNQSWLRKNLAGFNTLQLLALDLATTTIEDSPDLDKYINNTRQKGKTRLALLVLDADQVLREKPHLLAYLNQLFYQRPCQLLYFFGQNITRPNISSRLSDSSTLFQNILVYSYFNQKDSIYFLKFIAKEFGVHLPETVSQLIIQKCGGCLWLIKEAIRYYATTKDQKHLLDHESMLLKLDILYHEYHPEQALLEKIVRRNSDFSQKEKTLIQYLLKTRLIKKFKNGYRLTIPLLEKYIKHQLSLASRISLDESQHIVVGRHLAYSCFSRRQRRLLACLLQKPGTVFSRNQLAGVLWGIQNEDQYSEWALDQAVKRLRRKLIQLNLSPDLIQTVKNHGYRFTLLANDH
jgi:hypothetical protein